MTAGVDPPAERADAGVESDHFKPTGTVFILALLVATLILLWGSVYVILIARGVTVS